MTCGECAYWKPYSVFQQRVKGECAAPVPDSLYHCRLSKEFKYEDEGDECPAFVPSSLAVPPFDETKEVPPHVVVDKSGGRRVIFERLIASQRFIDDIEAVRKFIARKNGDE